MFAFFERRHGGASPSEGRSERGFRQRLQRLCLCLSHLLVYSLPHSPPCGPAWLGDPLHRYATFSGGTHALCCVVPNSRFQSSFLSSHPYRTLTVTTDCERRHNHSARSTARIKR